MGSQLTTRREDWPERLHTALLALSKRPFSWGQSDCLLSACDLIHAMTDQDPAASYRGTYNSQAGAMRAVAGAKCPSLEAFVAQLADSHGYHEVPPKMAQRGDLVAFDTAQGTAFGIVHLNGRDAVAVGESGLLRLPVLSARRAWRI
jgi:cell wall-associated NlpC family hydrolase